MEHLKQNKWYISIKQWSDLTGLNIFGTYTYHKLIRYLSTLLYSTITSYPEFPSLVSISSTSLYLTKSRNGSKTFSKMSPLPFTIYVIFSIVRQDDMSLSH